MGLLARAIESCGVTTVGLALVRDVALAAHAPRMLYLRWPFGHALGEPGNIGQHRTVLHDMLSMARLAPYPGLVVDLPYRWRRETYAPVTDWETESDAFARALTEAQASADSAWSRPVLTRPGTAETGTSIAIAEQAARND